LDWNDAEIIKEALKEALRNHSIQKLGLKHILNILNILETWTSKPLHSETWIETRVQVALHIPNLYFETTPFRNLDWNLSAPDENTPTPIILRNHSIQKLGLKLNMATNVEYKQRSSKPLHSETWIETYK